MFFWSVMIDAGKIMNPMLFEGQIQGAVHMGLARVNEPTCLPFAQREACQLCVDECKAAGYDAAFSRRPN